jgi:SAM-dependent methyltransferase
MELLKTAARRVLRREQSRALRRLGKRVARFGFARRCPCCKAWLRGFDPYGVSVRENALCPVCGSVERHRLLWLYLARKTDLFDGRRKRMLHVAPEPVLARRLQAEDSIDYFTADLASPRAMVRMDITAVPYRTNTFDVVYCSHVLEHVPDDRRAMREFHRVLRVGGWAILQVPIREEATFEDPSVVLPEDRERVFGHPEHVRSYGPDYVDRLAEAGFSVTVDGFARELDAKAVARFGLKREQDIYFCEKEGP